MTYHRLYIVCVLVYSEFNFSFDIFIYITLSVLINDL